MMVFVDTSAFLAILSEEDANHAVAAKYWKKLVLEDTTFITSNYVLVETTALLQRRHGLSAVSALLDRLMAVVRTEWVTPEQHHAALAGVLAGGRRGPSLVDCTSFELMRSLGIDRAFAFDNHYTERGYSL